MCIRDRGNSAQQALLRAAALLADWISNARHMTTTISRYQYPLPILISRVLRLQCADDEEVPYLRVMTVAAEGDAAENIAFDGDTFDLWYQKLLTVPQPALERAKATENIDIEGDFSRHIMPPSDDERTGDSHFSAQTLRISNLLAGKRTLLITDRGYLGSGPEAMLSSDQIYWIKNVSAPMALRPTQSQNGETEFKVMGPAFVYGFMDKQGDCENDFAPIKLV